MDAGTFSGITVLALAFLLMVATVCLTLWRALRHDSVKEDLRTLWNHYPEQTRSELTASFRKPRS
ncbi:MAG: hypothetical protein J7639_13710 [Paenibacillaceae bacterium]|nr:hypothetical protein [Paenibacillaceae bacterium]